MMIAPRSALRVSMLSTRPGGHFWRKRAFDLHRENPSVGILDDKIHLRAGVGSVVTGGRAFGETPQNLLDTKTFPGGAADRMPEHLLQVPESGEGVKNAAVPPIHL